MKIQIDCYRKLGDSELDELKFIARHMKRFGISKQWTGDGDLFNCGSSFVFHDYNYGLDLSTNKKAHKYIKGLPENLIQHFVDIP